MLGPLAALIDGLDLEPLSRSAPLGARSYRGLAELVERWSSWRAECTIAGHTVRGRPLPAFVFGPSAAPRRALVLGGTHALEWIGVEVATQLGDLLTQHAEAGALDARVTVLPVLNLDGFVAVEADLRAGRRAFVRANANGVDLNRNWPVFHRHRPWFERALAAFVGSAGRGPASEPETQAALRCVDALVPQRAVSLHSFGGAILTAHGARWAKPTKFDVLRAHACRVNSRLRRPYRIAPASRWVPGQFVYGMELDTLEARGIDALLVECAWGQLAWHDPASWLDPFRWYNPRDPSVHAAELAEALLPFLLE